jgi:hypothetical protein
VGSAEWGHRPVSERARGDREVAANDLELLARVVRRVDPEDVAREMVSVFRARIAG